MPPLRDWQPDFTAIIPKSHTRSPLLIVGLLPFYFAIFEAYLLRHHCAMQWAENEYYSFIFSLKTSALAKRFSVAQINAQLAPWKVRLFDGILSVLPYLSVGKANRLVARYEHLHNTDFIKAACQDLGIHVNPFGQEGLSPKGPITIVANHPGGADVIATIAAIAERRKDLVVLANSLICIDPVKDIVIPVNMFAKQRDQKVNMDLVHEAYQQGKVVVFFAAGKNSRYNEQGQLRDRRWRTTFLTLAQQYNSPIHSLKIKDKNSGMFYRVSRLRERVKALANVPLENMFQLREFLQPKADLRVLISKPIHLTQPLQGTKEMREYADRMRHFLYHDMDEEHLEFPNTPA